MSRKTHKAQHFVPRSYLKAWCDPERPAGHEPYVWIFDKDGANGRRKAPSNIFTENDLYTIKGTDGSRDLRLEHGLQQLESEFVRIRTNRLQSRQSLPPEQLAYLCAFVAAAQIRTVASRNHHAEQWGQVAALADKLAARMKVMTPAQRKHAALITTPSGGATLSHKQIKQLAAAPLQAMLAPVLETVTPILARMNMAVLCTNHPIGFITSDQPCIWFDPEAYKLPPIYQSAGLGSKTIEVTLPISPSQCLLFTWNDRITGYRPASDALLHEVNRRQRGLCEESYVVRKNVRLDEWFYEPPMPDDAWEMVHAKEIAERRASAPGDEVE